MGNKTPDQIVIDALNNKDLIILGMCENLYYPIGGGDVGRVWQEAYYITNKPDAKIKVPEYRYSVVICDKPVVGYRFKLCELKTDGQFECLYWSQENTLIHRGTYRKLVRRARATAFKEWVDVKKQNINTIVQRIKSRLCPSK